MLKITIEMYPHGDENKSRVIASGTINLQGNDTFKETKGKKGDYEYALSQQEYGGQSTFWKTWVTGDIKNFPRTQKKCMVSFIPNTKESI